MGHHYVPSCPWVTFYFPDTAKGSLTLSKSRSKDRICLFKIYNPFVCSHVICTCRHEITGVVLKVGRNVRNFKVGDRVGVGCLAASCLECEFCRSRQENYCDQIQLTYNGIFWDGSITYGGFSNMIVADYRYNAKLK